MIRRSGVDELQIHGEFEIVCQLSLELMRTRTGQPRIGTAAAASSTRQGVMDDPLHALQQPSHDAATEKPADGGSGAGAERTRPSRGRGIGSTADAGFRRVHPDASSARQRSIVEAVEARRVHRLAPPRLALGSGGGGSAVRARGSPMPSSPPRRRCRPSGGRPRGRSGAPAVARVRPGTSRRGRRRLRINPLRMLSIARKPRPHARRALMRDRDHRQSRHIRASMPGRSSRHPPGSL
jgi:hypothetical protein